MIRKLLVNETSKEDILNFIAKDEDDKSNLNNLELQDNNERNLIKNILILNEKSVDDIMVPRAEIISIEKNKTINEVFSVIENKSHSRMPVYDQNLDNVLGFLHIKDLIINNVENKNFKLNEILREILYVAPKSPILELLKRMRSSRIHMGLVVDEFGGVDGLITIEDLVEEIVGEIEDEHDAVEGPLFFEAADGVIEADARAPIADIEARLECDFLPEDRDEDISTLGGVVAAIAGRVPQRGEVISHPAGVEFEIVEADARRVKRLRLRKVAVKDPAAGPDGNARNGE